MIFGRSICINSSAETQRRSGIQSNFLDGSTSTKCQKLAEPTILRETTDRKIEEKNEKRQELMALLAGYKVPCRIIISLGVIIS